MDKINGILNTDTIQFADFKDHDGEVVSIRGYIHRIREMTGFSFVIIRTAKDTIQCVYAPEFSDYRWDEKLTEEACVKVTGKVVKTGKQKKVTVFKFKAKKNYRRHQGHRQPYTKIAITKIAM